MNDKRKLTKRTAAHQKTIQVGRILLQKRTADLDSLKQDYDGKINVIAATQNHLQVADLTQIDKKVEYKLPESQGLTDLIQAYYHNDIQKIIQAIPELSHLGADSSVAEVISTLQSLINKPPLTVRDERVQQELEHAQKTIIRLEKELTERPVEPEPRTITSDTPFGEDLQVIIQLELSSLNELFGAAVDQQTQKQIREAVNYSQVVQARQDFLAKHLNSSASSTGTGTALVQPTF